ncbi:MAG: hypothetical protein K9W46_01380 [Candidatus Heimdallarchaeum endolithica]|uniref:VCBS repeat-containing protein n=1 Tax=Candidatus Heimdallarchaeum endolithica TaxID=2876572 RepID=A0A9Y1BRQ8_9ARCH|nr:MAG: hypothetical protein K9W46_01380 [Candidatus Heimdallarchaeum endolithica]
MHKKSNIIWKKGLLLSLLAIMISSLLVGIPNSSFTNAENNSTHSLPDTISLEDAKQLMQQVYGENNGANLASVDQQIIDPDLDLSRLLADNPNEYQQTYQPWKSQAAVRCITISDDYEFMAVGGGYLFDNEVQVYRWNPDINQYAKVWVSGDTEIKGDVIDVDFGDTDNNDFLEIIASSSDGYFYVFEQEHIYDPVTNTENRFDLVYTSPYLGQVWGVEVNDTDLDHLDDIIVVSWDHKVHVYEYWLHSGYPFNSEHWITYREKWQSHDTGYHLSSLVVGDTNYNGLPDFVVGTREGAILVFENNGTILDIQGQPYPLAQDNSYKLIYADNESIWRPIYSMDIGNLDNSPGDEVVIASFAFNGYILRYDDYKGYYLQKLIKDFESWTLKDFYPADHFVDNGTEGQNVYFQDIINYLGTTVEEPILQSNPAFIKGNYPYNTGAAQDNDTCYTHFESNITHSAWEVYDFGADEEGTGNGNDAADILLKFNTSLFDYITKDDFIISISPDYEHWVTVDPSLINSFNVASETKYLRINVDPILIENKWNYFRYINVTVISNSTKDYNLQSIELPYVYQTVSTALSAEVGTLMTSRDTNEEVIHAILGTVDGRLVAFKYDVSSDSFVLSWDSWVDDRFTVGINIWDIEQVKNLGSMPMIYGYTDLGTDYKMRYNPSPGSQISQVVFDYTLLNIDGDSPVTGEFAITAGDGDVYYFDNDFNYDAAQTTQYFSSINGYATYTGNISIGAVEIDTNYPQEELLIGHFDPTLSNQYDDFEDDTTSVLPADIIIWRQESSTYEKYDSLYRLEATGQLREILKSAQSVPSAEGEDIDGDGDVDIVVCIENLYLLWNTGTPEDPEYVLDSDYFKDINEVKRRRQFLHPQFVEFEMDGIYDLSIGYSNRVGATYFDNYGTALAPKWEERKELVNNFDEEATINVYNFTRPLWIKYSEYDEYTTLLLEHYTGKNYYNKYYGYIMIDDRNGDFVYFYISNQIQTSFMVASNPTVSRIEVNTFKSEDYGTLFKWRNFGFRAIVSWTTAIDLYNWTLTVDSGDLDQDGKGEIIVGDYDSNVYIFEHMTNNTYKRAFRSPDMLQYVPTDETPYSWDKFGGYEGEFNQTIWNHVSYLLVNADSDGDGYLELAALAGTVLYVFEDTGIDDTYSYMYRLDVLRSPAGEYLKENGLLTPSGLTWAKDLDLDGYGEFIIAFERQVFVYEPYSGTLYELFGNVASDDPETGHYNILGNARVFDNITINGMLCSDINENGKEELFIYGSVDVDLLDYEEGFIVMIESVDLGYKIIWQGPTELVSKNIITDLQITDQDYDGLKELIIGGSKGVSIYEFDGGATTSFTQEGLITGHMNYPQMEAHSLFGKNSYNGDYDYRKQRSHDVRQIVYSGGSNNHSFISVFSEYNDTMSAYAIYQKVSHDGENWLSSKLIAYWYSGGYISLFFPSLTQTSNFSLWLAVSCKLYSVGLGSMFGVVLYRSDDYGANWVPAKVLVSEYIEEGSKNPIYSPAIFPTGPNSIGLVYIFRPNNTYSELYYGGLFDNGTVIPQTKIEGFDDFMFNGVDVDSKPDNSGVYAAAFSAKKYVEDKDDYDIWYCEFNSTYGLILEPRKLFTSFSVEHTPSITFVHNDAFSRLLTFDSSGLQKAMTLSYGMASDDGIHWSDPDILAEYPEYIIPPTKSNPYPRIEGFTTGWGVYDLGFRAPKVAPTYDGRFILLTKFDATIVHYIFPFFYIYYYNDYISQVYPLNFTSFVGLNTVTDLAVGDSDGDGRQEVMVADGNRAEMFELLNTRNQKRLYTSKWYSPEHDNPVSDVTMFDTNGNGFQELIYSVQGEDIYVYDVVNIHLPKADIHKLQTTTVSLTGAGDVLTRIKTDLNDDGTNDIIAYYDSGKMYAVLNNLTTLWTLEDSSASPNWYVEESIYQGSSAIIFVNSNGTTLWIDKKTGNVISSIVLGEGSYVLVPTATMLNYTKDNTMDIAILGDTKGHIYLFDGYNGSLLEDITYDTERYVQEIEVAHEQGEDYLIVSYHWIEYMGFIWILHGKITAYNLSSSTSDQLWEVNSYYAGGAWGARLIVDDINGDGDSEIYAYGQGVKLLDANGTEYWKAYNYAYSWDAVVFDINDDGIKDLITSSGQNYKVTALDGKDGNVTWSNIPSQNIYDLEVSETEGEVPILYLANSRTDYQGIIFLNVKNGGFLGYYYDTNSGFLYDNALVPTTVDSKPAVLAADNDAEKIYLVQINETEQIYEHDVITKLPFDQMLKAGKNINPDTIIYDNLNDDEYVEIFYIQNGNESFIYNPIKGEYIEEYTIPTNGSVLYAFKANLSDSANYDTIYIVTSEYKVGRLDLRDMAYTEILDMSSYVGDIASYAYLDIDDDVFFLGFYDFTKKAWYVGAWTYKGEELFSPIYQGSHRPDQINAGKLLDTSTYEDGLLFVVTSFDAYIYAYDLKGLLFDKIVEDGPAGFTALGELKKGLGFKFVYYQFGEAFFCYDLNIAFEKWHYTLVNDNDILSIAVGYFESSTNPEHAKVFVSQKGTGIYAFDDVGSYKLWYHRHNSFVAKYLHVVNDEALGSFLQVTDYHRTFYINGTTAEVLYATSTFMKQVLWVGTWSSSDSAYDSIAFFDGTSFYSRGIEISSSGASSVEEHIGISAERLTRLSAPIIIMMSVMVTIITVVFRKNKI